MLLLEYLSLVSSFWGSGMPTDHSPLAPMAAQENQALLDAWSAAISEGIVPEHRHWKERE